MFLFFTVVFITYSLIHLFKGNPYYNLLIKVGEEQIKIANPKIIGEEQKKLLALGFFISIPALITEVIYLVNAFDIDYLKYPTILMIVLLVFNLARIKPNNNFDLKTEEGKIKAREQLYKTNKKRTVKMTLISLGNLIYFSYMFYLQVF